jgi:hypothetical protein
VGIGLFSLVALAVWAWWATQLWGLPEVGIPFDAAAFEAATVPDDRNAFLPYGDASAIARQVESKLIRDKIPLYEHWDEFKGDWSKSSAYWHDRVGDFREALAHWREGSERPEAFYHHPEGLSFSTLLPVTQHLRLLANLACLEGSRLEDLGDFEGAWGWYRAVLRSSRHSGSYGFHVERGMGVAMHKQAAEALTRWASNPRVTAPLLRRALDEVIAIDTMTVKYTDILKRELLVFEHELDNPNLLDELTRQRQPADRPDWCADSALPQASKPIIQRARVFAHDDRERSLRVSRLMIANWMAEVDKPASRRAPLAHQDPPIYAVGGEAPAAARALPPEALAKWYDSTLLASRHLHFLYRYTRFVIDGERRRQARLVVHLASELHRREHGSAPTTPAALVGTYLKELPEGYDLPEEPGKP